MSANKLTKYAFNLADIICWLIVILLIASLISTFIPPIITTWSIAGLPKTAVVSLEFFNTLLTGIGFYLLIKRKVAGFALILFTSIIELSATKFFHIHSIYYSIALLSIIGFPWILSYKEVINAKET